MNENEIFGEGGGLPGDICDGPFGMAKRSALIPTNDPESYNFQKGDIVYRNYVSDELKGKVLEVVRGRHDSQMIYVDWGNGEVTMELSSWLRKDPTMVEHHDLWPTVASVVEKAFNPPQTVYENDYGLKILSTRRGWVILADKTYRPASNIQDLNEVLAGLPLDFYPEQLVLKAGEDGKLFSEEDKLKQEFASGFFDEKAEEDLDKVGAELASLASSMGYKPQDHMSFLLKEMNFQESDFLGDNRGTKALAAMKKAADLDEDELEEEEFNTDEVEVGDYVDFGPYGKLYVTNLNAGLGDRPKWWVTDEEEDRYNPKARGWFISPGLARGIIEKGESREGSKKAAGIKVQAPDVKSLIHSGLEAIKIHGSLATADKEIYNLVKDTFGEAVADENTGVMADILKSQGLTASFASKKTAGIDVGDIIEYDLDKVKQYSTRARMVNSVEGRVKAVHSNGYTVVADGVAFFVNNEDVIGGTGFTYHKKSSKLLAGSDFNKFAQKVYKWAVDKYGEEAPYFITETHEIWETIPDIVDLSKEENVDEAVEKIYELVVGMARQNSGGYVEATKRTALQDGIPPNSSPGWNEFKGDFDTFKRRGLDDKPTTEEDAKRQTNPEIKNPFEGLNIPEAPDIGGDTLSGMEPGDRREIDNLLAVTRDISSKIMDSVKGLNENDQIPDTLKEDVNKLNDVVKQIDKMSAKYKTNKEEVKTQVDLSK